MLGDEIWAVTINGAIYKGGMTRKEADKMAEHYAKGCNREKDNKIIPEVVRDKVLIKEMDERYKTFKRGEPQTHGFYLGR